ncbi:MAG TPA: hypothetical protein VE972_07180 [Conexibacter sp.]|nr:hypothetical protein [Conexibacter sp.]
MWEAVDGLRGSEALHFAACRWLELLDPTTHFSRAATSVLDPVTALDDFSGSAEELIEGMGTKYWAVLEQMRMLRSALQADANLARWFRRERAAVLSGLKSAGRVNKSLTEAQKHAIVRQNVKRLLRGPIATLKASVSDEASGYQARLLKAVAGRFAEPPLARAGWRVFDRDLAFLASLTLSQGRDAALLGGAVVLALAEAPDAAAAGAALAAEVVRAPINYDLALVIDGVEEVVDATAFGFEPMHDSSGWCTEAMEGCDEKLRDFIVAQSSAGVCAIVKRKVEAHDRFAAYALALGAAEELVAHMIAEHRVNDITLRRAALALDRDASTVWVVPRAPRAAIRARALGRTPLPELSDPLRHYARARGERAPTLAVRDTWVALEGIAHGAERELSDGTRKPFPAGSFLPPHAAAATVLAALRNQLLSLARHFHSTSLAITERERWDQLSTWLNGSPAGEDGALRRFAQLVAAADGRHPAPRELRADAPPAQAGAVLIELANALGPYSRQRVAEIQECLSNAARLGDWCAQIDLRAQLQLRRMKFLRHRVVHRAVFEDASIQLATAAHDLADAVFEVLPNFLAENECRGAHSKRR